MIVLHVANSGGIHDSAEMPVLDFVTTVCVMNYTAEMIVLLFTSTGYICDKTEISYNAWFFMCYYSCMHNPTKMIVLHVAITGYIHHLPEMTALHVATPGVAWDY